MYPIVIAILFGVALIIVVASTIKSKHSSDKTMSDIAKKTKEKLSENAKQQDERICTYCGTKNEANASNCQSCGAPLKQKKTN